MKCFLVLFLLSFLCVDGKAQQYTLSSPDKKLLVEIVNNQQGISLKMTKEADRVLSMSDLGMI
ncbi:MAG: hypothetical protein IT250_17970, partial [Chitinophagaceae bacterium]|nr:hypothetical protein [Chitinophagaceae bacterium]